MSIGKQQISTVRPPTIPACAHLSSHTTPHHITSHHVCLIASYQIFVVLRHEVYPKFVARVVERSKQNSSGAAAAATSKPDFRRKKSSSLESPVPVEQHRVSWLESDEVAKAVRAELSKCYY